MPEQPRAEGSARHDHRRRRARRGVAVDRLARAERQPHRRSRARRAGAGCRSRAGLHREPARRSLVLGRTQTVAVVVPDLGNPTFQAILRGLSRAAAADGYHVLIADSAESVDEERVLAVETRRRTDGLILCAPRMPRRRARAARRRASRPVVLVNREAGRRRAGRRAPTTAERSASSWRTCTARSPALVYLAGVARSVSNAARLEAIARFRAAHPDVECTSCPAASTSTAARPRRAAVLASGATAVLAFNDLVAMGLLSAVQASGCRVPADLSIVGFDDIPFAAYTTPPLTTAAVPAAELGARAWAAMRALLEGARAGASAHCPPEVDGARLERSCRGRNGLEDHRHARLAQGSPSRLCLADLPHWPYPY